jgi:cell division protein FtsA
LIRNLGSCIGGCHLDVAGYVSSAYASGLATLVEDELELGVTVIDMGGSQTTVASFMEGNLLNVASIPLGGNSITNDIARGLGTPLAQAERLKTLYGTLMPSSSDDRESIFVHAMGETDKGHQQHVSKGILTHIIRSRIEEILELVVDKIRTTNVDPLAYQRFVLTGGASQLQGLRETAAQVLTKQVRLGYPTGLQGTLDMINSPSFSTCAGLLHYGLQAYRGEHTGPVTANNWSLLRRLTGWFKENF